MEEIRNKVKESGLIPLDIAKYKPNYQLVGIDVAEQLWQGLVLKEKDFRLWIKEHNWNQYENKGVYVFCSADALVPTWAYMLIVSSLHGNCKEFIVGSIEDLEKKIIVSNIKKEDLEALTDAKVIIKGCADIIATAFVMSELNQHLQSVVSSIMYGEPCSTVPIYKKKK